MTGSILHTPFVFSYMRRGSSNNNQKKATVVTTSNNETTVVPSGTDDTVATQLPTDPAASNNTTGSASTTTQQQVAPAHHHHPAVYETSIRTIRQVHTIESFWETYDYLKRPNDLPPNIDYHFFRCITSNGTVTPIKPTWEDVSRFIYIFWHSTCVRYALLKFLISPYHFTKSSNVLFGSVSRPILTCKNSKNYYVFLQ
jgi:hypothetical protein